MEEQKKVQENTNFQEQPGYGEAEQPQPETAGYGVPPVNPDYGHSVNPGYGSQMGYGHPVNPGYGSQAGYGAPMQPQMGQSGYGQPMNPGYGSRADYGVPVSPQIGQPGYGMPMQQQPGYGMPPYGGGYRRVSDGFAIASMVLGIVSILACSWFYLAIPCAIIGLVLGCLYRVKGGKSGMSIAGIVCSSCGLALGMLAGVVIMMALAY